MQPLASQGGSALAGAFPFGGYNSHVKVAFLVGQHLLEHSHMVGKNSYTASAFLPLLEHTSLLPEGQNSGG